MAEYEKRAGISRRFGQRIFLRLEPKLSDSQFCVPLLDTRLLFVVIYSP